MNKISSNHIGLLVFGVFSASIRASNIPPQYRVYCKTKDKDNNNPENQSNKDDSGDDNNNNTSTSNDTETEQDCWKTENHTIKAGTILTFTVKK